MQWKYQKEILYAVVKENSTQYCMGNYISTTISTNNKQFQKLTISNSAKCTEVYQTTSL